MVKSRRADTSATAAKAKPPNMPLPTWDFKHLYRTGGRHSVKEAVGYVPSMINKPPIPTGSTMRLRVPSSSHSSPGYWVDMDISSLPVTRATCSCKSGYVAKSPCSLRNLVLSF